MGWEVFYQATFIPTPIRLMVLTSKREGNCNVVTCRLRDARDLVTPQPRLPRDCYELFFVPHQCRYNLIASTSYYRSYVSPSLSSRPETKPL